MSFNNNNNKSNNYQNGNGHIASASATDIGGCHLIDWKHPIVLQMPNPTRIFSFLVISIMSLRYLHANEWKLETLLRGFYFNPYVVVFFVISTAVLLLAKKKHQKQQLENTGKPLPVYDAWAVEWYFWNAWLYHAVMDGASGSFELVPTVVQQYAILDARFPTHHIIPWIVGCIELFIMAPLCLITLYMIQTNHTMRFPMELITSTFQLMGTFLFMIPELWEQQVHIPALDPVGVPGNAWANVKFNFYHLTYYWFGFWFCNTVWIYVPLFRIHRAVMECTRALQKQKVE